tara:strand:- start:1093 stop:1296 length:204 start_codon:yes stop_codon:yes gene_type:complete
MTPTEITEDILTEIACLTTSTKYSGMPEEVDTVSVRIKIRRATWDAAQGDDQVAGAIVQAIEAQRTG